MTGVGFLYFIIHSFDRWLWFTRINQGLFGDCFSCCDGLFYSLRFEGVCASLHENDAGPHIILPLRGR